MEKTLRICDTCRADGVDNTVTEYQCEVCGSDICSFHAYPFALGLVNPPVPVASIVICDSCRKKVPACAGDIQATLSKSKKVFEEFREAVKKNIGKET